MSAIDDELQLLRARIIELEQQKLKEDEDKNKYSITHNFCVIDDILTEKKKDIKINRYSKKVPLARYYDEQLVNRLEAVYNILQIMDKRLSKLEENKE